MFFLYCKWENCFLGDTYLLALFLIGIRIDWSTYALWWPAKTTWLLNGSFTLDNWEISAADILEYVPKLYTVQLMLPDLQVFTFQLDFSKRVFEVVKDICRKLCKLRTATAYTFYNLFLYL